jgi:hypothetical protein
LIATWLSSHGPWRVGAGAGEASHNTVLRP